VSVPFTALLLTALSACSAPTGSPAPVPARAAALQPVALPDLSRADDAVQAQARERHAALLQKIESGAGGADLGAAYGELGMLLHAAESYQAAEPCYLNARTLMPADPRWPYYLARLYQVTGRASDAEAAFSQTLELSPDDVPSLVRLGRMRLDRGDAAGAETLFARAREKAPRAVAVLAGLGQTALASRQFERAAQFLEQGLAADPRALSLHAPLANAYRALGRTADADAHLKQWRNTEVPLADPRSDALGVLVESGLSYELRGVRAMSEQDWKGAAALFRKGITLASPGDVIARSLHHKLGTALWMMGDDRAAIAEFELVAREAPALGIDEPAAKAHYSLGILMASRGRDAEAIRHLSEAVRYQPSYAQAHLALGDALRRRGRFAAALAEYEALVRIDPRTIAGRFGYAMALVRLQRYVEARDWLVESLRVDPGQPDLLHALARVLAASPDDRARDGRQAIDLVRQLSATRKTPDVGETLAMALAEIGDYRQAVEVQRGVLDAAQQAGLAGEVQRLAINLKLYESRRPCRTPWRDDDPVHRPGASAL
jgi:tetratricopeptide (TPR) repeat protein